MAALILIYIFCDRMIVSAESSEAKDPIKINWAFGALIGPEKNRKLVNVENDTILKTGDQFKMMVEFKSRCFVYLIYSGSKGEILMLFPEDISQFNRTYKLSEKYYIPPGDLWFALDEQVGLEKFYLLASKRRLSDLEDLLKKYESLGSDKKPEMARNITTLIRKTIRKRKTLAAPAERPVRIGGTVRGVNEKSRSMNDIATLAVEITANKFFSKTFTIKHK
jgi:hypothetical protein